MLGLWIVLASSAVIAAPQAATAVAPSPPKVQVGPVVADARLEGSAHAIDEGKFALALERVDAAQKDGKLSAADGDWASYLRARALAGLAKGDEAESTVKARFDVNPNDYTWASLVAIYVTLGHYDLAAGAILDLKEEQFIWVNRLRPGVIDNVVTGLGGERSAARDKLIVRLVEGRYSGPSSQHVPDTLRLGYINLLLRQQRIEDAARQTQSVEMPAVLSILLTDKSYEPLWQFPSVRALMAPDALVARVDRGVQARLEQPTLSSSDWLDVMRALRVIGRADEAVRLGLHALKQARTEKRAAGPALRLEMANAYADLGQSWAARRTARELQREEPSLPLSLRLALAQVLELSGDDEGALSLLGTLEGAARSPAVLRLTVCAAHDLGRNDKRDAVLAELEALKDGALVETFDALVCTGHNDRAATVLSGMLNQPELRATAILTAQLYADPVNSAADQNDTRYRMRALVASAAVQDAIKPFGRSIALPFTIANARLN